MTTLCRLGNCPVLLLNASLPIEVNVLGIVQEVPSSDRRRRASAFVKTVILEEEEKMEYRVSNYSTRYKMATHYSEEEMGRVHKICLFVSSLYFYYIGRAVIAKIKEDDKDNEYQE